MTFRDWLSDRYHAMSAEYRMLLQAVLSQCRELAEGNIWQPHHTDIAIICLEKVPVPVLGKYPGETSEDERLWFGTAPRPQWRSIMQEYVEEVKKLETKIG
jgi:hypothetical protein